MTPQERQLVDELFDRLSKLENAPRDPDAAAAISEGLRKAPNAVYALAQTVLLQDEALKHANARIQELEAAYAPEQRQQPGGFLDSMRETLFGPGQSHGSQSHGSVPNVRPPESRPVWNSGQVLQQQPPGYDQPPYGQPPLGQGPLGQVPNPGYGAPPVGGGGGGGGSFLGTAAAAAAGMLGSSLLLNGIRNMMGGSHHGIGDAGALGNRGTSASASPWSGGDQSSGTLARDAGIGDIGSGHRDESRQGFLNQASNDDQDDDQGSYDDNDDGWDDDGGDDGGGDYA